MPRQNFEVPDEAMGGPPPAAGGAGPAPGAGAPPAPGPGDSGEAQVLQAVQTLAVFAASLQQKNDPKATAVMAGLQQIAQALGAGAEAAPPGPEAPPPEAAPAPAGPPGARPMNAGADAVVL